MKIALLYAVSKYDQHLVPELLKKMDFVDDTIVYDDTNSTGIWRHHGGEINNALLSQAHKRKFDWVLCIDPDERIMPSDIDRIKNIVKEDTERKTVYQFHVRDLFSFDKYRVDGKWGRKQKKILFPIRKENKYRNKFIHSQWNPINSFYKLKRTNMTIWHLKHISKKAEEQRRKIFELHDKNRKGDIYSYLTDRSNMILKDVPKEVKDMLINEFGDESYFDKNLVDFDKK